MGIPEKGLPSHEDEIKWLAENIINKRHLSSIKKVLNPFYEFERIARTKIPYAAHLLSDKHLKDILQRIFAESAPDFKYNQDVLAFGQFDLVYIINGKKYVSGESKKIAPNDGIYIKIGPYSPITEVKDFINQRSSQIRLLQDAYRREKGLRGLKLPKVRSNLTQNWLIAVMMDISLDKLKSMVPKSAGTSKEYLIADFLSKTLGRPISAHAVKKAHFRFKKYLANIRDSKQDT